MCNLIRSSGLCLSLFLLSACETEPITGRWVPASIVSEAQANEMGVQSYQQMLQESKLSPDAKVNALVESVGRRIARVTDARMAEEGREAFQWEFKVIDDPKTVNAFCLPGGKVAFYTGIIPICQDESGIAVVMGHEVGHAYAMHGKHRVSNGIVAQVGLQTVQVALGASKMSDTSQATIAALGAGVVQLGVLLPFSREDESAADHIGLILMAEAGYDPRPAVEFWQRMSQLSAGQKPPEFLSTHPSDATRVEQLKALLPDALKAYEKARGGGAPAKS